MSDLISRAGLFNALAGAQDKGEIFAIVQTIPEVPALNWLADEIHQNAVKHGWWEGERNEGESLPCAMRNSQRLWRSLEKKNLWSTKRTASQRDGR